jgi:outer membrane protein assembly factor BamD (BamD/ComL family)
MKKRMLVIMIIAVIALSSCSGDNASELFETAKFEELQNNKKHAMQLYEDIIKKYPQSEFADKAKERLSALNTNK